MPLHTTLCLPEAPFGSHLPNSWPAAKPAQKSPPLGTLSQLLLLLCPQHPVHLFCVAHTDVTVPCHIPPLVSVFWERLTLLSLGLNQVRRSLGNFCWTGLSFGSPGAMGMYSKGKIKERHLLTFWLQQSLALTNLLSVWFAAWNMPLGCLLAGAWHSRLDECLSPFL